jgi:hypothetical protein
MKVLLGIAITSVLLAQSANNKDSQWRGLGFIHLPKKDWNLMNAPILKLGQPERDKQDILADIDLYARRIKSADALINATTYNEKAAIFCRYQKNIVGMGPVSSVEDLEVAYSQVDKSKLDTYTAWKWTRLLDDVYRKMNACQEQIMEDVRWSIAAGVPDRGLTHQNLPTDDQMRKSVFDLQKELNDAKVELSKLTRQTR